MCLQHLALEMGEESLLQCEFLFPGTVKRSLKINLHCTCPCQKTEDTSVIPFFSHANILPPSVSLLGLCRLSRKQRVQKYHTTNFLMIGNDFGLWDIAQLVA